MKKVYILYLYEKDPEQYDTDYSPYLVEVFQSRAKAEKVADRLLSLRKARALRRFKEDEPMLIEYHEKWKRRMIIKNKPGHFSYPDSPPSLEHYTNLHFRELESFIEEKRVR